MMLQTAHDRRTHLLRGRAGKDGARDGGAEQARADHRCEGRLVAGAAAGYDVYALRLLLVLVLVLLG
jgi:hypothetical protein